MLDPKQALPPVSPALSRAPFSLSFPRIRRAAARLLASALGALGLVTASFARAEEHALLSGPFVDSKDLQVEAESLSLSCYGDVTEPVCSFESTARIVNHGDAPVQSFVVLYGVHVTLLIRRANGRDLPTLSGPSVEAAVKRADAAFAAAFEPHHLDRLGRALYRSTVRINVPAKGTTEVSATGTLRLFPSGPIHDLPLTIEPLVGRHPWGHLFKQEGRAFGVQYLASLPGAWAKDHKLSVKVRAPKAWAVNGRSLRQTAEDAGFPGFAPELGATRAVGDGEEESSAQLTGPLGKGEKAITVHVDAHPPDRVVFPGGAFIGIGSGFGPGDLETFRMRAGYELAAPGWLIDSISFETDFRRRTFVTPAAEVATYQLFFLPALSLGVGVPVQISPVPTAGARLLLGAQIFMVGIVGTVDFFPGLSGPDGQVQGTLMARLSM